LDTQTIYQKHKINFNVYAFEGTTTPTTENRVLAKTMRYDSLEEDGNQI
jgi:hypothetical protein